MSLFENKYVQIFLAILAFYIFTQIVAKKSTTENMDTVVSVPGTTGEVTIGAHPSSTVSVTNLPGEEKLVTVTPPQATIPAPTPPLPQANGSAAIAETVPSPVGPAPLTSLHAPAPGSSLSESTLAVGEQLSGAPSAEFSTEEYNKLPADYSSLFTQRNQLDPADLIPKVEVEDLYGNLKPDPKLDQNFLQNAFSAGISVEETTKNAILDIRGLPPSGPNPRMIVSPWQQPSTFPSSLRKSLADVC